MSYMSNKSICLTISHNVFLTREERYALVGGKSIRKIGVSVPIWLKKSGKTDEPAEEIFCWYELHGGEEFGVEWTDDGYLLFLTEEMRQGLRDVSDFGSASVMFTNHGRLDAKKKVYDMLNFVSIQADESLLKSMS